MDYFRNFARHLVAPLTGEGWSNKLARDFWTGEDIWDPRGHIRLRWLKLLWVYAVSSITQVTIPLLLLATVIDAFFKEIPIKWWIIGVGGASFAAIAFSVLISILTYCAIRARVLSGE